MKKRIILVVSLAICLVMLSGCTALPYLGLQSMFRGDSVRNTQSSLPEAGGELVTISREEYEAMAGLLATSMEAEAELEGYVGTADVVLPNEPAAQPEQPAVQPQPEAQPEQPAAPQAGTWTCAACGTANTGKFCIECGAAQPQADGAWICASCGTANTGKFCTECGAAKPAADWTCPNCKTVNAGKFCSECGTARP